MMPRPQCQGWRPNLTTPSGVWASGPARLTAGESVSELTPERGGTWVSPSHWLVVALLPRTTLSSTSIWLCTEIVSVTLTVGSRRSRMLVDFTVSGHGRFDASAGASVAG